jgi:hypothetical protein
MPKPPERPEHITKALAWVAGAAPLDHVQTIFRYVEHLETELYAMRAAAKDHQLPSGEHWVSRGEPHGTVTYERRRTVDTPVYYDGDERRTLAGL